MYIGLIDVADHHDAAVALGEEVDELELRGVGVLELVDEDVTEAVAVALEGFGVFTEEPHREHEQIVEVDSGRFLQAPLVLGVHVREPALAGRDGHLGVLLREHQLVLQRADLVVQRARREALRVQVQVAAHPVGQPLRVRPGRRS